MTTVVIYGPPASGKTRNAEALRQFFGCTHIYEDDVSHRAEFPKPGALILTQSSPDSILRWQLEKAGRGIMETLVFHGILSALRQMEMATPTLITDEYVNIGSADDRTERERKLDQEADFWLVWSPTGKSPPTKRHYTQGSAEREAGRLAANNPGQQFYVLEPRYEVAALLTRIRHAPPVLDEEVPF